MESLQKEPELLHAQVAQLAQVTPEGSALLDCGRLSRSALHEIQNFIHQSFAALLQLLLQELPSLGGSNFFHCSDCRSSAEALAALSLFPQAPAAFEELAMAQKEALGAEG